ncbi:MAG: hypothetical protein QOG91_396 [Candidatus Parcubacteria bacterium]|jgi:hypothetical protein|nr:hypothetical protein [Candidatus Parcubacteria bacterium]
MQTNYVLLQDLIPKWLTPLTTAAAQYEQLRYAAVALKIDPHYLRLFANISQMKDAVQSDLCKLLIQASKPVVGEEVTYYQKRQIKAIKKNKSRGWYFEAKVCRVTKVSIDKLSLFDGRKNMNGMVPLHCAELLARIGVIVDFENLYKFPQ